jgi:hypothetical protein
VGDVVSIRWRAELTGDVARAIADPISAHLRYVAARGDWPYGYALSVAFPQDIVAVRVAWTSASNLGAEIEHTHPRIARRLLGNDPPAWQVYALVEAGDAPARRVLCLVDTRPMPPNVDVLDVEALPRVRPL